ncbi:GNAT family N-acetyltransferase [Bacillus coahuilensis]|uniref:GNAT family N-acetyltransferase n=1 Tax=Bacillus coahuilensis TaxID=408580 RepID=UPI0001850F14|nr:GNAT family N-acetyltransferase [Bacillus coahuilensis]
MVHLEKASLDELYIMQEILNSQPDYLKEENGKDFRTKKEIEQEFFQEGLLTYFIKLEDTYIGLIHYMKNHKKDNAPWIGLLILHSWYVGHGFAQTAYHLLQESILKQYKEVYIGIVPENHRARKFWERNKFKMVEERQYRGSIVDVYKKSLSK